MKTTPGRNPDGTFAKRQLGYRKKTCTSCGKYLYLGQFYKHRKSRNHPDGLRLNADGQAVEKRGCSVRLYWGEERLKDFRRLFPFNTNEDVAIDMGCSVRTVIRRAREMGLEKNPQWLQNVWNKNIALARGVNKICGNKANLANFIEAGKPHRFTAGRTHKHSR